jgi:hypothetical protein
VPRRARHTLLSMMKDEGPDLLEWVAHHRLIGFDNICVYTNDCRDGTDAMLDRLEQMGVVRHFANRIPAGKKPQPNALNLAEKNACVIETDWLVVLDADEFIHIKPGAGQLADLFAACPQGIDGVAMTWRMMGSNGRVAWSPEPVIAQFDRGAPDGYRYGWGIKMLFRPFDHMRPGIHRPKLRRAAKDPDRLAALEAQDWVNGSGYPMSIGFKRDHWRSSGVTLGRDLVEVAHFAVKSAEGYLLRRDRGNVNNKPDKYDATYFGMFDRNEETHGGLQRHLPAIRAQIADWLADPDLARLYHGAVAWQRDRLATIRGAPGHAARIAALKMAAAVPYDALSDVLFMQPLPPRYQAYLRQLQARGLNDLQIARIVADAIDKTELARDAADAADLAARL